MFYLLLSQNILKKVQQEYSKMDTVQTLNRLEYEWVLSDDKISGELLRAEVQELDKITDTPSSPLNCNETFNTVSPLISYAKFFWQISYDTVNTVEDNLEVIIAKNISENPEVEYIILSKKDHYYQIWTVINKLDRKVRDSIYDIEYNILENFREIYFDFHVVCREDRRIDDILPRNAIIFYRRTL